jgi:ribosome-interacting GTPase 1
MPANLTPEFLEAQEEYRKAETIPEKLAALERMLATIPKHKGTEKMQADIKRRIAKLKEEAERQRRSKTSRYDPFAVERHGAGQVVVIGPPNAGKSALVAALTGAPLEVADYPFTTQEPEPAMMPYEDIQVQLVDTPPVVEEVEGPLAALIRSADGLVIVLDLSTDEVLDQAETVFGGLERRRIRPVPVEGEARDEAGIAFRPAVLAGNKADALDADVRWALLLDSWGDRATPLAVSARTGAGLEELRRLIFRLLHVIRVYAKPPGQKPDLEKPFILPEGSTVLDLAEEVHRDWVKRLKMARVWGSAEFDGQAVARNYALKDKDIVELHV